MSMMDIGFLVATACGSTCSPYSGPCALRLQEILAGILWIVQDTGILQQLPKDYPEILQGSCVNHVAASKKLF